MHSGMGSTTVSSFSKKVTGMPKRPQMSIGSHGLAGGAWMDKAGGVPVPRPKWTPQSDRAGEASSSARSGDEQIQSGTFDGFFKDALSAAGRVFHKGYTSLRQGPIARQQNNETAGKRKQRAAQSMGMSWYTLRWEYSREGKGGDTPDSETAPDGLNIPVLHDRKTFVKCWDVMVIVLLAYTAAVVPYQVAFAEFQILGPAHTVSIAVDIVFVLDTILQFNISYYSTRRQVTVLSRKNIVTRYLKGAFPLDLISLIPLECFVIPFRPQRPMASELLGRVFYLIRMVRLLRIGRIARRVEASSPVNYGVWTVFKFLLITAALAHWVACLWGLIAKAETTFDPDGQSWMSETALENGLTFNPDTSHFSKDPNADAGVGPVVYVADSSPHFFLYTLAVYFAVYTMASVGYGDLVPVTDLERYAACGIMLLGSYFLGYIVASITSVVATRNADNSEYYRLMDQLGKFMDEHRLDKELRLQLRSYFHYRKQTRGMQSWNHIIAQMSPSLRREVLAYTSCQLIQNVAFFKKCDDDGSFIMDVGMRLETSTYTPKERIINMADEAVNMHIVRRGVVASEGSIYMREGIFGLDVLEGMMSDSIPTRNYWAIALTYSDLLMVSRSSLQLVMKKHPRAWQVIRRRILRRMMKQEIRAYTAAMTRILTNRRPYWTRLRGDCGGREQHYYDKLLTMVPVDAEFAKYLEMVTAATKIQRCVRNFLRSIRIQKAGGVGALATRRPSKSRARTAEALKGMLATEGLVSGGNRELNSPSDGPAAAARRCTWQEVLFELETLRNKMDAAAKHNEKPAPRPRRSSAMV